MKNNHSKETQKSSKLINGQSLLANIAKMLTGYKSFREKINAIMYLTGTALHVSRVYIFEDDNLRYETNNTFEWCADGIKPQKENLQHVPMGIVTEWYEIMGSQGFLYADNIKTLPESIQLMLEPQQIISIVVFKLDLSDGMTGFVGFDECVKQRHWTQEDLDILITITGLVSSLYENERLHEKILANEANFKNMFNSINDFIVVADLDGYLIEANDAVYKRTPFAEIQQRKGKVHILDMHPPQVFEDAKQILLGMISGEIAQCNLPIMGLDNKDIQVETKIYKGTWNGQNVWLGISKDVTAEREAADMFNKVFKYNPLPMAVNDLLSGKFIDINAAFTDLLGYSKEAIIEKTNSDLHLIPDFTELQQIENNLNETGKFEGVEITLQANNNNLFQGLVSGAAVVLGGRKCFVSVFTDLTQQIAMKNLIADQKRRLELIVESTELGTWEWDLLTDATVFNERWAQIIGRTVDELIPTTIHTWEQFLHPEDHSIIKRELHKYFRGETSYYSVECRMLHADGGYRWIHDTGKVLEYTQDGKASKMFGTHRDITRKKQIEQQLQEAKNKAEDENEAKSKFLAMVSHEIRTPIHTMQGLVELLNLTTLDERQRSYALQLQQSSGIVLETINSILDFSKIEAEKIELTLQPFLLNELLEDLCNLYVYRFAQKEVDLCIDFDPETPLRLVGDKLKINQILQNLLSNAAKFTREGNVTIRVKGKFIDKTQVSLDMYISDTGIGIAPNILPIIFEPYVQGTKDVLDNSMVGSGLGLPIVKQLVELMNGTIEVDSAQGIGSIFHVNFSVEAEDDYSLKSYWEDNRQSFGGAIYVQEGVFTQALSESLSMIGVPVNKVQELPIQLKGGKKELSILVVDWEQITAVNHETELQCLRSFCDTYHNGVVIVFASVLASELSIERMLVNNRFHIIKKPVCLWKILRLITQILPEEQHKDSSISLSQKHKKSGRILLCDDHVINREMMAELLQSAGYQVETAYSGELTLQMLKQSQFDLLLLDIQMQDMDGFEVTQIIRNELQQNLPILAFTAHAIPQYEQRSREVGMNGYLVKPVAPPQLYKEIDFWLPDHNGKDISPIRDEHALLRKTANRLHTSIKQDYNIDFLEAMDRYNYHIDKYREHLLLLIRDIQKTLALNEKRTLPYTTWQKTLHIMRGVAGNLGLNNFVAVLAKAEKQIPHVKSKMSMRFAIKVVTMRLREELENLIRFGEFIDSHVIEESYQDIESTVMFPAKDLKILCDELGKALTLGEIEEAHNIAVSLKGFVPADSELMNASEDLLTYINRYEFQLARRELLYICSELTPILG